MLDQSHLINKFCPYHPYCKDKKQHLFTGRNLNVLFLPYQSGNISSHYHIYSGQVPQRGFGNDQDVAPSLKSIGLVEKLGTHQFLSYIHK